MVLFLCFGFYFFSFFRWEEGCYLSFNLVILIIIVILLSTHLVIHHLSVFFLSLFSVLFFTHFLVFFFLLLSHAVYHYYSLNRVFPFSSFFFFFFSCVYSFSNFSLSTFFHVSLSFSLFPTYTYVKWKRKKKSHTKKEKINPQKKYIYTKNISK